MSPKELIHFKTQSLSSPSPTDRQPPPSAGRWPKSTVRGNYRRPTVAGECFPQIDLVDLVVSAHCRQENLFFPQFLILDQFEKVPVTVTHGAGPRTSQLSFQLVAVQRRVKRVFGELLKGALNPRPQFRLAANRPFEGSHKGRTPDKGSHSASSFIKSATVPRRTSPRW